MKAFRLGLIYFLWVFAAGFLLGMVRVPLLVPRLGVRTAELLEMPIMAAVIVWASRRMARGNAASRGECLLAGGIALGLTLSAEIALTLAQGKTVAEYVSGRDPVSGMVYAVLLVFFALAPALWPRR